MSHTSESESNSRFNRCNSRHIDAHSWKAFHGMICKQLQKTGVYISAYGQVSEPPNMHEYFECYVTEEDGHTKLSRLCLYQLTQLGHTVLEVTNDKDIDLTYMEEITSEVGTISHHYGTDKVVGKFCKAVLLTKDSLDNTFSVGETVYEYTSIRNIPISEGDRKSALLPTQLQTSLNPDHCWPVNIVSVVEIEKRAQDIAVPSKILQSAQYLECLLRGTPGRNVAFGVVTNLRECIFIAVTVKIGSNGRRSYVVHHSAVIPCEHLVLELTSFAATPAAALGHTFRFPDRIFTPIEFLGRGSTGTAILGHWQGQELVMKLSVHLARTELERRVARYTAHLNIAGMPRIHAACQEEVEGLLFGHCNVFTERFDHIDPKLITVVHLKQIWSVLCDLHDAGLVHRDIRPPNICLRYGRAVLIDLSNCMFYDPVLPLIVNCFESATITTMDSTAALYDTAIVTTASDAVQRGQPTLPADEACALLYCAMQVFFETPVVRNMKVDREDFVLIREEWADDITAEPIPPQVATIKTCLAHLASIRETSTQMGRTDAVHKGLHAICELSELVYV